MTVHSISLNSNRLGLKKFFASFQYDGLHYFCACQHEANIVIINAPKLTTRFQNGIPDFPNTFARVLYETLNFNPGFYM